MNFGYCDNLVRRTLSFGVHIKTTLLQVGDRTIRSLQTSRMCRLTLCPSLGPRRRPQLWMTRLPIGDKAS